MEWEKIIIFQQKPISQPQASLCPKGNISIPLLMEQISNQNMYSKIIEAMQCQHIMLPSAFPGARNQLSTLSGVTESQGNAEMSELRKGGEEARTIQPLCSSLGAQDSVWKKASKVEEANLKTF